MKFSHTPHLEQALANLDDKYNLVRQVGVGGLRYILVAREPDKVGLDSPASRRRKRKVQVGNSLIDVKAFSIDMDYDRLGFRHQVPNLHEFRKSIISPPPACVQLRNKNLTHLIQYTRSIPRPSCPSFRSFLDKNSIASNIKADTISGTCRCLPATSTYPL
jgi:hypothetical protein